MPLIPLFIQLELDVSDSDLAARMSAWNFSDPFDHVLPFRDSTIDANDRAHLWGAYNGLLTGFTAPEDAYDFTIYMGGATNR